MNQEEEKAKKALTNMLNTMKHINTIAEDMLIVIKLRAADKEDPSDLTICKIEHPKKKNIICTRIQTHLNNHILRNKNGEELENWKNLESLFVPNFKEIL